MSEARRRVALVTGAASGIGAAICRALAGPETAIVVHTRANRAGAEAGWPQSMRRAVRPSSSSAT